MTLTEQEIRSIQVGGIDWYGNPLKMDGKYGPKTAWWRGITTLSDKRQTVIKIGLGYHAIGAGENTDMGPNRGTFPDSVLKPAGLIGKPWCVAFCSYVLRKSNVDWPVYLVSTYRLHEWAQANNRIVKDPLPGDIMGFFHDAKPGDTQVNGHGEFVIATDNEWVYDFGGNIGDMVRVGRRARHDGMFFVRTVEENKPTLTCPTGLMRIDQLGVH